MDTLDKPLSWAVHQVGPLETFVNGKVCLLGDAAHAMAPHRTVGAGLAINDAYVLSSLLAAVSANDSFDLKSDLPTVLDTYDTIRRPSVTAAAVDVRENGLHLLRHVLDEEGEWRTIDFNSTEDIQLLQKRMVDGWLYAWDKSLAIKETEKAVEVLLERLSLLN